MGFGFVEMYKEYEFGADMGACAMAIAEIHSGNGDKGRGGILYYIFLHLWKFHSRDNINHYRASMRLSFSAGDRIYASFAHLHVAGNMFFAGYHLADCLVEAEACYDDTHAWSASADTNILIMCIIRTIKALQGHTHASIAEGVFDGDDGFSDSHFISESCKMSTNIDIPLNWYDSYRMIPLVLYGHYEYAIAVGYMCIRTMHNHPCHRHTRIMLFYHSLALIEKLRTEELTQEERSVYLGTCQSKSTVHQRLGYSFQN